MKFTLIYFTIGRVIVSLVFLFVGAYRDSVFLGALGGFILGVSIMDFCARRNSCFNRRS